MYRRNPFGVVDDFDSYSQGIRFASTLGWMTLPLWGNQTASRATCVAAPGVPEIYPDPKKLVTEDCIKPIGP